MSNKKTFTVTCHNCGEKIPSMKIGEKSYVETECPHCHTKISICSSTTGVKTSLLTPPNK